MLIESYNLLYENISKYQPHCPLHLSIRLQRQFPGSFCSRPLCCLYLSCLKFAFYPGHVHPSYSPNLCRPQLPMQTDHCIVSGENQSVTTSQQDKPSFLPSHCHCCENKIAAMLFALVHGHISLFPLRSHVCNFVESAPSDLESIWKDNVQRSSFIRRKKTSPDLLWVSYCWMMNFSLVFCVCSVMNSGTWKSTVQLL